MLGVYDPGARALERWAPLKDFVPSLGEIVPQKGVGPRTGTETTRAMSGNIAARFFQAS